MLTFAGRTRITGGRDFSTRVREMSNDEDKREARELLPSPRNFAPQKLLGPAPDSPHLLDLSAAPVPRAVPYELTAPEDASERFAFALWGAGRKREAIEFLERQIDLRRDASMVSPHPEPVEGGVEGDGTGAETAAFPHVLDPGAEDAQPIPPKSAGPVPLPRPVTSADAVSAAAPRRNKLRLAALAASLVLATSAVLAMNFLAPPLLGEGEGGEADVIGEPTPLAAALPSPRPEPAEAQPVQIAAASPAETGSLAPVETSPQLEADEPPTAAETEIEEPEPTIAETSVEASKSVEPIEEVADATPTALKESGSADTPSAMEEAVVATASPAEESRAVEPEIAAPIEEPAAPAPIEEPASAALPLPHPQSPTPNLAATGPTIPETPDTGPTPAPGLAALAVNAPPPEDTDTPLTESSAADSAGAQLAQPPPPQSSPLDPLFAALGMPDSAEAALAGGAENSFAVGPRIPAPRPEFTPDMLVEEPRPTRVARAEASPAPAPPPPDNDVPILRDVPPGGRVLYGPDGEPLVIWRAPGNDGRRFWERGRRLLRRSADFPRRR